MTPYLVIGRGRLSRHFQHYFRLEAIDFEQWDRSSPVPIEGSLARARAVLLLISDDAIEGFLQRHADRGPALWVHCSGSISTPLAESAHPLMCFGTDLYELATYRRIPFVCDAGRQTFGQLFPELRNPHVEIDPASRALYHALCSMGGNFTTLLWQKVFAASEATLGLDRSVFFPFLEQVARNLTTNCAPLTGPLARGDDSTIDRHLQALEGDPFEAVYRAFVSAFHSDPSVRTP